MKHLSNNDFDDNLLTNVPDGTNPQDAVNKRQLDTKADKSDIDTSTATIKHYRHPNYAYEIIEIKNPKPTSVMKRFAPGVDSTGAVNRVTPREFCRDTGYKVAINADGFENADGTPGWGNTLVRPTGLQIADNTVYIEWDPVKHQDCPEAVIMQANGELAAAFLTDGKSGADWVSEGALWSIGWGYFCVLDGESVDPDSPYNNMQPGNPSARTVLCQKPNKDMFIIQVEGKTGTYGATVAEMQTLALSLGAEIAFLCDAGGSVQSWWNNAYAMPSSDRDGVWPTERAIPTFITIEAADIQEIYDSGNINVPLSSGVTPLTQSTPGFYLRQIGPSIHATIRVSGNFPDGATTQITSGNFPMRYFASSDSVGSFIRGNSGNIGTWFSSPSTRNGVVKNDSGSAWTVAVGNGRWPAPHTELDYTEGIG